MSTTEAAPAPSFEANLAASLKNLQSHAGKQVSQYRDQVREKPETALIYALVAGYLLRSLPIAAVVTGIARLLLALVRPAAFLFGAAKFYEFFQQRKPAQ